MNIESNFIIDDEINKKLLKLFHHGTEGLNIKRKMKFSIKKYKLNLF